jgi:hypothetical protein
MTVSYLADRAGHRRGLFRSDCLLPESIGREFDAKLNVETARQFLNDAADSDERVASLTLLFCRAISNSDV